MRTAGLILLTVLASACGSSGGSTPDYDYCQASTSVIFDPLGDWLLPFPSDFYLRQDPSTPSGFRIDLDAESMPAREEMFEVYPFMLEQLNALDGFGTSAAITFGFSAEIGIREQVGDEMVVTPPESLAIDPGDTVLPASPVVLIGIDEDSPDHGRAIPVILEYLSDRDERGRGQHFLLVEPAFPLRPATTYAAALTRRLEDKNGKCLAPSRRMRELLEQDTDDIDFGLLGERLPDALELLREGGFIEDAGDLAALVVFSTQSIEGQLLAAAGKVLGDAAEEPPVVVPGSIETQTGSNGVALVVTGRFLAPDFQDESGKFEIEDGLPIIKGHEELEFELIVPEETEQNKPPFPIVIYQHGLIGHKEEDMSAKRAQARAGFASLAIDAVLHGSRKADTGWEVTNFFGIDLSPEEGHAPFDMELLRDNFRQCYLDIVSLAELVPVLAEMDLFPPENPDGVRELAAAPIFLSGHSLGGIIVAGAIALSPRIPIANISAGGGSLPTNLFMRSDIFSEFIGMLQPEGTTQADVRRFMPILQILVERGDPVNLARLAIAEPPDLQGAAAKHVLFQAVLDDSFVPNQSNEALARAFGLDHLNPVLRQVYGLEPLEEPASLNHELEVSAAFFQFDVLSGGQPAEHTEIYSDDLAQTQWIHFFGTYRETGEAELADPYRLLGIERP